MELKRGRKGILEQKEILETIREILEETGSENEAIQACQLNRKSYERWIREKPEFGQLVEDAKAVWFGKAKNRVFERRAIVESQLDKLLRGELIRTRTKKKVDPDGNLIEIETIEEQILLIPSSGFLESLLPKEEEDTTIHVQVDFNDDKPVA